MFAGSISMIISRLFDSIAGVSSATAHDVGQLATRPYDPRGLALDSSLRRSASINLCTAHNAHFEITAIPFCMACVEAGGAYKQRLIAMFSPAEKTNARAAIL
jgi:hypothetical protein